MSDSSEFDRVKGGLAAGHYARLIQMIRLCLKREPWWMIEQYWQGHR